MNVMSLGKKLSLPLPSVEDWIKGGLIFLISRASVFGVFPFGLACCISLMSSRSIYLGVCCMILGVFSSGGEILKYALATGLFLIYDYFKKDKVFDPIFCGFSLLISGIISIIFNSQSFLYIAIAAIEALVCMLTCFLAVRAENFYKSYKGLSKASQEEVISLVLLCGIILTGFSGIYITKNIHLSVLLGIYLILLISRVTSISVAGSVGLALGFICSMNTSNAIPVMGICGVGAILSNLLKDFGKIGSAAGFLSGGILCLVYIGNINSFPLSAYEYSIAVLLFFLTPKIAFQKMSSVFAKAVQPPSTGKEGRIKEYLSGELKQIAKAFTDLAESFVSLSHQHKENTQASDMFDEISKRICSSCSKWGDCWIEGFNEMYRHMYEILKIIEMCGYCDSTNLPIVFKDKCIRPEAFIAEFNHIYELYKQNALWHGEVTFGQDMVAKQYHEISNLIKGLSEEVETGFSFIESAELKLDSALEKVGFFAKEINVIENIRKEPEVYISSGFSAEPKILESVVSEVMGMPMRLQNDSSSMKFVVHNRFYIEYAVCQHSGESEQVCGDTVMQFETDDNKFCVLICDGMGSGDEAFEESRLTAGLFHDFIKAGFIKDTAVKMINSTLAMKAGHESFSTIDLTEIDLRTGTAEFLKVGAAESYLMQKNEFEIISSKAMPVGILEDVKTSGISRTLSEGDIIIMISDGISDTGYGSLRGTWIKKIISEHDGDMQELADKVLKAARKKSYPKPCDDMTVAAMKLKKII